MIPGVTGSSQYVVPASGTVYTVTPGKAGGTGTVGPKWSSESGYVYWDDDEADLMAATPFPTSTFSDKITTGLGINADYDGVTQLSYANGYWFLCNNVAKIIYRIDPTTYSVSTSTGTFATGPNIVAWFAPQSKWVAVGDTGRWWSSTDGVAWTQQTAIGTDNWNSCVTDGSTFVMMSNAGTCQSTTNLTTWTSRTSSFGTSAVYRMIYVDTSKAANVSGTKGVWLATGATGKVAYSTNGTTWTQKATGIASGNTMVNIYHMGRFIILNNNAGSVMWRSNTSDPSGTWSQVSATTYSDAHSGSSSGGYLFFLQTGGKFHYAR